MTEPHDPRRARRPNLSGVLTILNVTLPIAQVTTSQLGFGCAGLFREPSGRKRKQLLALAYEHGIRHFDTAPMYGLGQSEAELGKFARSRRGEVVIATKFGLDPTSAGTLIGRVQAPIRSLLKARPGLNDAARSTAASPAAGDLGKLLYRYSGFDAENARRSLERSLRRLHTDYVDLLLLHEPPHSGANLDDVGCYLEGARSAGIIRAWGVAGDVAGTYATVNASSVTVPVIQTPSVWANHYPSAHDDSRSPDIVFGALAQLPQLLRFMAADADRSREWAGLVGVDFANPEHVADALLRVASEDTPGVVLFTTTREDHIRSATETMSSGRPGDLAAFRTLLERHACEIFAAT